MIEAHRTPDAMARCLISYIADDARVRSEVYTTFGMSPTVQTIRDMRRIKARADEVFRRDHHCQFDERGWDWRGQQHRADMEIASKVFVAAIHLERAAKYRRAVA